MIGASCCIGKGESVGRGGRRPGAGRKPNELKCLGIRYSDPRLARLTPEELQALEAIARKIAAPAQDASVNQTESKPAIILEVQGV
jgi:hypothetical protein